MTQVKCVFQCAGTVQDRLRQAKGTWVELGRCMKGNNKVGFYRHVSSTRKTRENVNVLLLKNDMEKAKILQACIV